MFRLPLLPPPPPGSILPVVLFSSPSLYSINTPVAGKAGRAIV